jgi:hypothetical protein
MRPPFVALLARIWGAVINPKLRQDTRRFGVAQHTEIFVPGLLDSRRTKARETIRQSDLAQAFEDSRPV